MSRHRTKDVVSRTYSIPRELANIIDKQSNRSESVSYILLQNIHRFEAGDVSEEMTLNYRESVKKILELLEPELESMIKQKLKQCLDELLKD